jgi:hypothetical protein
MWLPRLNKHLARHAAVSASCPDTGCRGRTASSGVSTACFTIFFRDKPRRRCRRFIGNCPTSRGARMATPIPAIPLQLVTFIGGFAPNSTQARCQRCSRGLESIGPLASAHGFLSMTRSKTQTPSRRGSRLMRSDFGEAAFDICSSRTSNPLSVTTFEGMGTA